MSIPPLVCSTPPPPDQCEDEKISDDFDIGYNLSEEYEEQNAYEYNDFCTFNTYKTSGGPISIEDIDTSKTSNNEKESTKDVESQCRNHEQENFSSSPFEDKKVDEDNIEDLDLQLEDISSVNTKESSKELDKKTLGSDSGLTDTSLDIDQIEAVTSSPIFDNEPSIELSDPDIEEDKKFSSQNLDLEDDKMLNTEQPSFTTNFESEEEEKTIKCELSVIEPEILNDSEKDVNFSNNNVSVNIKSEILSDINNAICSSKAVDISQLPFNNQSIDFSAQDDDFGDFDDFQFRSSNVNDNGVYSESSPWTDNDTEDVTFKANFDEFQMPFATNQNSSSNVEPKLDSGENNSFDDFDDFKSSENDNVNSVEIKCETDTQKSYSLSPLDISLSHNDIQITEIVDKVLSSVFQEEISANDAEPERILSSFLCETWGHLIETEIRQPYIVNWNNSLNQKILLKALCIDSRNILFGPKWNHMPKYAANLGSSPLQPKKSNTTFPSTNDSSSSSALNADNWSEPINIEGKEFTYAEALLLDLEHLMATLDQMAHNHSALKISELLSSACSNDNGASSDKGQGADEYSQPLPIKPEKIYPNTLNLQPIRQINLPDTHIYTPTDSEIPRSKTIHYDIGAPILIPQLTSDTIKTSIDTSRNDVADDEYSEFQNFQCGTDISSHTVSPQPPDNGRQNTTIIETLPLFNMPLENNSVLQPIKVEPKLPTLNWPDPGEVKEVFEDFTMHSVWNKSKESVVQDSMNTLKNNAPIFGTVPNDSVMAIDPISLSNNSYTENNVSMTDFDDEFDTFQSAAPMSISSQAFQTLSTDIKEIEKPMDSGHIQIITPNQPGNTVKDSEFSSFILSDLKQLSDSKISSDYTKLKTDNQADSQSGATGSIPVSTIAKTTTQTHNPLVTDTKILQPIPASSVVINPSKQATGQILQPLSLESYTQINWPNPGITLQDVSAFNPVQTIQTIKAEASGSHSKTTSPIHVQKNQMIDDEMWSDFVSVNPKVSPQLKKQTFTEDDEWSDFISSPNVNPHNGLNTISLNVHTNLSMQNSVTHSKHKQGNKHIDIPTLNYITPKSNTNRSYTDRHFQNL